MGRHPQKTSPFRLRQLLKGQQDLDMRLAGRTYQEIAKALGYANASGPYLAIQALIRRNALESLEELRDLDSIDTVLKIQQRRARLYGLDKPVKVSVEGEIRKLLVLKIGDRPPRIIDLTDLDLKILSEQELVVLRQLQATQVIEGEVLETREV